MISALKTDRGLALPDLINGAYEYIETISFKPHARIYLLDFLATTEYATIPPAFAQVLTAYALGTDYQPEVARRYNLRHS